MASDLPIELDINKRWEEGIPHHPESEAAIRAMAKIDFYLQGDSLGISLGGDGDNGEAMMYALDIYFEARDRGIDWLTLIPKEQL